MLADKEGILFYSVENMIIKTDEKMRLSTYHVKVEVGTQLNIRKQFMSDSTDTPPFCSV